MEGLSPAEVDSRFYSFAYLIGPENTAPADFPIPSSERNFRIALFLPRDDPDWFGRSSNPPRILLLLGDAIVVLTHPKYNVDPVRIPISDLAFCEAGQVLLIGWIRFVTSQTEIELPYNTRSHHPVSEFLRGLMEAYLPGTPIVDRGEAVAFGPSLDIKFRNYLAAALVGKERVHTRFFSPPVEVSRRWGPWRVRSQAAGDLVAFTNRRALWITDRRNGSYERYGNIVRTTPLHTIGDVSWGESLMLTFRNGASWRIPLSSERLEEAKQFAAKHTLSEKPR